jgi:hypothetical protein
MPCPLNQEKNKWKQERFNNIIFLLKGNTCVGLALLILVVLVAVV